MPPDFVNNPPRRICLIRLSALGDVTHILPVVHTLRAQWPEARITWIIGKHEHRLAGLFPDIDFRVLNKKEGWGGYRQLWASLRGDRFDMLLLMQTSFRAHLASLGVKAPYRLGYDRVRSRDLHGLFINDRIPHRDREHVLDQQFGFLERVGITRRVMDWSLPLSAADREWAAEQLPGEQPTLIISPASSVALRNWFAERYAAVADHAIRELGMRVVICGGPSDMEYALADGIMANLQEPGVINLVGKDTIPRFLALLERAAVLISPDSGPAHMAAITDTPCIGLYGVSNAQRCGPYKSLHHTVDAFPIACEEILHKPAASCRWGTRVETPEAMQLVSVDAVCSTLDHLIAPD